MRPQVAFRSSAGRFLSATGEKVAGVAKVLARHGATMKPIFGPTEERVMARQAGRSGPWGAFLDSTLDRFGDAAIFGGIVLWGFGVGDDDLTATLALAALVLGSVVPYARARAEGLGMNGSGGIAERADRLLLVLVATGLVGFGLPVVVLTVVLGLLTAASAVTVVQRMAKVRRQARALEVAPTDAAPEAGA